MRYEEHRTALDADALSTEELRQLNTGTLHVFFICWMKWKGVDMPDAYFESRCYLPDDT